MRGESALRIVSVYPSVLGTYGDRGNVTIIAARAARRGIRVTVAVIDPFDPVPEYGDVYVLGGAEDTAQTAAVEALRRCGGLPAAVGHGAAVFAVCAGYQLLGESVPPRPPYASRNASTDLTVGRSAPCESHDSPAERPVRDAAVPACGMRRG